jgi:hypothetical protein
VLLASTREVLGRRRAGSWGTKLTEKGSAAARWLGGGEAEVFQRRGVPTGVSGGLECSYNSEEEGRGEAAP